jgi:hypothetical protein
VVVSGYNTVRKALGAAVQEYEPDINIYYYVPRTLVPPAVIVQPAHRTVSYLQGQSSRSAEWRFNVMVIVGQVSEEGAQEMAGELISPRSLLVAALNNTKLEKGYAQVTDGTVAETTIGGGVYTHVQLSVCAYSP